MPMERSVSCAAERPAPAANDLRCYSASYVTSYKPAAAPAPATAAKAMKRATSSVQRSGSTRSGWGVGGGVGPTPGFNLRSYSASYAASYSPFEDPNPAAAAKSNNPAAAKWASSAAGRRSVNLRGYTPSFAALDDTAEAPPVSIPAARRSKHQQQVSPTGSAGSGSGGLVDEAELQRRKRLVGYKAYDVEGKVKDSVRRSFKWIKGKYSRAVDGSSAKW
uniref:Uncharacterized protein n=1 Tax=Leersia perrieri TaxID=77586 RepID=A0A0D9VDX3_9ORYZ